MVPEEKANPLFSTSLQVLTDNYNSVNGYEPPNKLGLSRAKDVNYLWPADFRKMCYLVPEFAEEWAPKIDLWSGPLVFDE